MATLLSSVTERRRLRTWAYSTSQYAASSPFYRVSSVIRPCQMEISTFF